MSSKPEIIDLTSSSSSSDGWNKYLPPSALPFIPRLTKEQASKVNPQPLQLLILLIRQQNQKPCLQAQYYIETLSLNFFLPLMRNLQRMKMKILHSFLLLHLRDPNQGLGGLTRHFQNHVKSELVFLLQDMEFLTKEVGDMIKGRGRWISW